MVNETTTGIVCTIFFILVFFIAIIVLSGPIVDTIYFLVRDSGEVVGSTLSSIITMSPGIPGDVKIVYLKPSLKYDYTVDFHEKIIGLETEAKSTFERKVKGKVDQYEEFEKVINALLFPTIGIQIKDPPGRIIKFSDIEINKIYKDNLDVRVIGREFFSGELYDALRCIGEQCLFDCQYEGAVDEPEKYYGGFCTANEIIDCKKCGDFRQFEIVEGDTSIRGNYLYGFTGIFRYSPTITHQADYIYLTDYVIDNVVIRCEGPSVYDKYHFGHDAVCILEQGKIIKIKAEKINDQEIYVIIDY